MSGRLMVVTGTETAIGKTHLSTSLLLAARERGHAVFGYKPIESGVDGTTLSDAHRLAAASSPGMFHVKPPQVSLRSQLSPHLAAEREGLTIPWPEIVRWASDARRRISILVELPGGLFTPISRKLLNIDALRQLAPDLAVLVAPDRLGVLHHVLSTVTATRARDARPNEPRDRSDALTRDATLDIVALVAPAVADASTGTNAPELSQLADLPILGPWPRGESHELAALPGTVELIRRWLHPA